MPKSAMKATISEAGGRYNTKTLKSEPGLQDQCSYAERLALSRLPWHFEKRKKEKVSGIRVVECALGRVRTF